MIKKVDLRSTKYVLVFDGVIPYQIGSGEFRKIVNGGWESDFLM